MKWQVKNLGEICDIVGGGTPSKANLDYYSGTIPWVTVRDMKRELITTTEFKITEQAVKKSSTNIISKNNVIIATRVGLGKVSMLGVDSAINQDLKGLIPKKNNSINIRFLFWWYKSVSTSVENAGVGLTVKGVKLDFIKKLPLPVPSLLEQQQIAEKLDTSFDLIDRAKANIEKNIQNAKELFQSKLNQVFSQKGEGWEEIALDKVCTMKRGHNPPKSNFIYEPREGYVRFYQIRDGSSEKNAVYVPDTPQLQRVEPDDILMVAYRHVGRAFRGVSGCFNVALCKISNNDQRVLDNDFLFYLIPSDIIRGELLKHSERSLIPSMSVEHLKKLAIPLPPLNEQKIIVELLNIFRDSTEALINKYQQKLANLEELKKSILEKAFKGELI